MSPYQHGLPIQKVLVDKKEQAEKMRKLSGHANTTSSQHHNTKEMQALQAEMNNTTKQLIKNRDIINSITKTELR